MSWQPDDVARSIRRYLSLVLDGPPWRLRTERREVADDQRPVGVVSTGAVTVVRAREALTQGEVETMLPVTITLYPEVAADEREGQKNANDLRALLSAWLSVGVEVRDSEDRLWSGPFRIPLYDYAATPISGPDRAGPPDPHDVLWVDPGSLSVDDIQDPDDPRRWTVICEFRVSVEAPGRVNDAGLPAVSDIDGRYLPS